MAAPEKMKKLLLVLFIISGASLAETGTGTGFAISDGHYYVTNHHVIEGAASLCLRANSGELHSARVINFDESDDLAVLYSDLVSPPLVLAPFGQVKKGLKVIAVGYPDPIDMGFESKVTEGIISSLSGYKGDPSLIQISSPIQPGNSGGPLISEYGNVVGVVVARLAKNYDEPFFDSENVAYAVNVAKLQGLLETTKNIQVTQRIQLSGRPLSVVELVSMSENSVVMILGFSKRVNCEGFIPDNPQFSLADGSQLPRSEQEINEERDRAAKEEERKEEQRRIENEKKEEQARIAKERKEAEEARLRKERQKEEEIKKAEAESLERARKARAFRDALASIDTRWELIYKSPGFKKWTSIEESEIATIFSNDDEISTATELLASYKRYLYEIYESAEVDDISSTSVFLGGIESQYFLIGRINEVNSVFKYFVSTADREVPLSTSIWFYHEKINDWVSAKVSRVGDGWVSAVMPTNMTLPSVNAAVYMAK